MLTMLGPPIGKLSDLAMQRYCPWPAPPPNLDTRVISEAHAGCATFVEASEEESHSNASGQHICWAWRKFDPSGLMQDAHPVQELLDGEDRLAPHALVVQVDRWVGLVVNI